jgi:hypothetical protein
MPPINKAVTQQWHKEHCNNPAIHKHPQENYEICATCGNYIQIPLWVKILDKAEHTMKVTITS